MPITIVMKQVLAWHRTKIYMVGDVELWYVGQSCKHKVIGPDIVKDTEEKVQVI